MSDEYTLNILAIQRLLARYCIDLDARDFEPWSQLWAPEAEMHAFGQVWTGPDEITEHIEQSPRGLHLAGIPDVHVNGDHATGRQNFVFVEADGHALRIGVYHDTYVRNGGIWLFASRAITFVKADDAPAG